MDREKIEAFLKQTGLKRALVRGQYYLCEVREELTAWENQPYDAVTITPLPPPIELI